MKKKEDFLTNVYSDNSAEAHSFYAMFWQNTLSKNEDDYKRKNKMYGGETIISLLTFTGVMIGLMGLEFPTDENERVNTILDAKNPVITVPKHIKEKLKLFNEERFCTLANFMPLPLVKENGRIYSLNLAKNRRYKDFPDEFFMYIRDFYLNGKPEDHVFMHKENSDYFDKFRKKDSNENGWRNFVETNCLQPFFTDSEYSNRIKLKPCFPRYPYRYKSLKNFEAKDKVESMEQIYNFIEEAVKVINKRAEHLSKRRGELLN